MLTLKEMKDYARKGYSYVPLVKRYVEDEITTITTLKRLKKAYDHVFMLESAMSDTKSGRYSFLGADPKLEMTACNGYVTVREAGQVILDRQGRPEEAVRQILSRYKTPHLEGLPPFTGGLVGYFAYEFYQYQEEGIDFSKDNVDHLPDMDLMLFDRLICYDHYKHQVLIIVQASLEGDLEANRQAAMNEVDALYHLMTEGKVKVDTGGQMTSDLTYHFEKDRFKEMVETAQEYIKKDEVSQVVLSNYLKADFEGSLLDSYRYLRSVNPSPYMIYFSSPNLEIAGASPETLGTLESGVVKTYPLAGTRPRGATEAEDKELEKDLLADEKEVSEHQMLVEIGQTDLAQVCDKDSIVIEDYMVIHKYSHVMHIGSCVKGDLSEGRDAMDVIKTLLPAGTLSGDPKLRACQIIQDLEGDRRDIYGGAIGYIDLNGNMDACIAIRLIFKRGGKIFIRSGAGIVEKSDPGKEFQECINKARATVVAIEEQDQMSDQC